MSTLAQYRARIAAHEAVTDALITTVLVDATTAHTASTWGSRYNEAMVYWAAHRIECTPGSGADGLTRDGEAPMIKPMAGKTPGPVVSVREEDRTTTYASVGSLNDFTSTVYGLHYLAIRASRAASAPTVVTVGT